MVGNMHERTLIGCNLVVCIISFGIFILQTLYACYTFLYLEELWLVYRENSKK